MKSIKFSDYISVVNPTYKIIRLKPHNAIRNNTTDQLSRAITTLDKEMKDRIIINERKVVKFLGGKFVYPTKATIKKGSKFLYFIHLLKTDVRFYCVIPNENYTYLKEKINNTWKGITIEEIETLPDINDFTKEQLYFRFEDGLSLTSDKRDNDFLANLLNVTEQLTKEEEMFAAFNINITDQKAWRNKHKAIIQKHKESKPLERDKSSVAYLGKYLFFITDEIFKTVISAFDFIYDDKSDNQKLVSALFSHTDKKTLTLSDQTNNKGSRPVNSFEIISGVYSPDKRRLDNLTLSLTQAFDVIAGDNELLSKPYRKKISLMDKSFGAEKNILSDIESQNFLSLTGRSLLDQYKFIEHIETLETEIPEELRSGVMCIGTNTYRGNVVPAYLTTHLEFRNLLLMLIGPTRAGKSNLIGHLSIDAVENDECVIIFDFIERNQLSDEVSRLFPDKKVLNIDLTDRDNIQGLGYNEMTTFITDDIFGIYEVVKKQTTSVLFLINAVNVDGSRLSARMDRYLECACVITFLNRGSIRDVYNTLNNHHTRQKLIKGVDEALYEYVDEYIDGLLELNETDKEGNIIGTKTSLISGINDRFTAIKKNAYMELMLKKGTENNINLVEEMNKNQVITIRMPEFAFPNPEERDVLALYWSTKIWNSLVIRAAQEPNRHNRKKVNIFYDELTQVEFTEKFIKSKLSQIAKFTAKLIISCHYIRQLTHLKSELRSANTSYMLLAGCDRENYEELSEELKPFTSEDLLNMKSHYSLNYLKIGSGYTRFITKLPDRVENRKPKLELEKENIVIKEKEDKKEQP